MILLKFPLKLCLNRPLDRMNLVSKSRPVSGLGFLSCWPQVTILGTNSPVSRSISGLVTEGNQRRYIYIPQTVSPDGIFIYRLGKSSGETKTNIKHMVVYRLQRYGSIDSHTTGHMSSHAGWFMKGCAAGVESCHVTWMVTFPRNSGRHLLLYY